MLLRVEALEKYYMVNNQTHPILSSWSGVFNAPGVYALIGPSGAGKTTLLRILAGFEASTAGRVVVQQEDGIQRILQPHEFSFIPQFPALFDELTVYDNVRLAARTVSQPENTIVSLLAELGLSEVVQQRPYCLSGGMKQRVSVAQALIRKPRFIFADEPTASLDAENRQAVLKLLCAHVRKNGIGLILSTHDMAVAGCAEICLQLQDAILTVDCSSANKARVSTTCSSCIRVKHYNAEQKTSATAFSRDHSI